ncbi:MAG: ATP-binding protein [Chloroherpetonaceae bacterium]|nr:ATP-binding protein [Chloroherpetonaceae bacterium]
MLNLLLKSLLFILILPSFFSFLRSQTPLDEKINFKRLLLERGESQSRINKTLHSKTGLLWVATSEGLARYNGYQTYFYRNNPLDSTSLPSNDILFLIEKSSTELWIATDEAVSLFNPITGKAVRYYSQTEEVELTSEKGLNGFIQGLHITQSGKIWVGTSLGLYSFNPSNNQFEKFELPFEFSTRAFKELPAERLVIGGESNAGAKLLVLDGQSLTIEKEIYEGKKMISGDAILSIESSLESPEDLLWVGTRKSGLYQISLNEEKPLKHFDYAPKSSLGLRTSYVKSLSLNRTGLFKGILFIGTSDGLHLLSQDQSKMTVLLPDVKRKASISDNEITSLSHDYAGTLWIGTASGGLNLLQTQKSPFKIFDLKDLKQDASLGGSYVNAIYEDGSVLWVGTNNGLLRHDLSGKESDRRFFFKSGELLSNTVNAITKTTDGRLWLGTDAGISIYDPQTKKWGSFQNDLETGGPLPDNYISSFLLSSKGTLWVGTASGLSKFNPQTNSFETFTSKSSDTQTLPDNEILTLFEDNAHTIWVGTGSGLCKMIDESGKFERIQSKSDKILSLSQDFNNKLWIGTSYGLYRLEPTTSQQIGFFDIDGLADNTCFGLLFSRDSSLWISTPKGISKYMPSGNTFITYDVSDGLASNNFNFGAYHVGKSGTFYFGAGRGITAFDPETFTHRYTPPVVITAFKRFGKIENDNLQNGADITLSYLDSFFSFEFASLDFVSPEKNQYAYKLEGFDNDWVYSGSQRVASYTNLDGGNYRFMVKGSNGDGIWNNTPFVISIHVIPPPWKTWWAYTLYVLFGVGSILGIFILKALRDRKKLEAQAKEIEAQRIINDRLQQLDKLKDEFLANTSHELRTPLNGIIGISESLIDGATGPLREETKKNLTMITFSGKRLANLVNDILDFSKLKNQNIELLQKPVDMRQIVEIAYALLRPLIQGKPIVTKNEIPDDFPSVQGDENRIQQILLNVIGNAIKFTESGEVKVTAKEKGDMLEFSILDTGIGIAPENYGKIFQSFEQGDASSTRQYGGTGLGLSISKKLIELHGGSIWFESEVNKGSIFTISLPKSVEVAEKINLSAELVSKVSQVSAGEPELEEISRAANEIEILKTGEVDSRQFRVLVVDDEPVNVQVLANQLRLNNYSVSQAVNGVEALKIIDESERFDVILLDIMMPKMSGYEVCRRLREKYPAIELPVILLTAKNQVDDLVEGFNVGANDYLTKPFTKKELFSRIRTHISLSKITLAYGRFVPHEFLRFLERESIVDVKLGDQVQREMTILFSDIRSFTSLSEKMTPVENFNFINSYLRRMGPMIRKNNGFIDKYIGDAIMALFPLDADDAVKATIEMRRELKIYNQHRENNKYPAIEIGLGLHTGNLMLGTVGESERMEGTVIADAVNLASRMEGLTKIYGATILISDKTYFKLKNQNDYSIRALGKVQVKGKKEAVSIYEIFDEDYPKLFDHKLSTKERFFEALDHYYNARFDLSLKLFQEISTLNKEDKAAKLYISRCNYFIESGTPEDWVGADMMSEK